MDETPIRADAGEIVELSAWVTWVTEPFDLSQEPDVRLIAPENGWYELVMGADRQARLVKLSDD